MKQALLFIAGILIVSGSFAQTAPAKAHKGMMAGKGMISGYIKNMHNYPMGDVKVFIYAGDTILGSGYTDGMGRFETNAVVSGTYVLKLVYPSMKAASITDLPIKAGKDLELYINIDAPAADTTLAYSVIAPPEKKGKAK